jgi:hypothetical protein
LPTTDIRRRSLLTAVLLVLAALAAVSLPAVAGARTAPAGAGARTAPAVAGTRTAPAGTGTRTVSYRGYAVKVPTGWPVFRLKAGAHTCVRFDRHAVYLGAPSATQRCPADPLGRTEAILVSPQNAQQPAAATSASLLPTATGTASRAGRSAARIVDARDHVVITATWGRDPGLIRRALSTRSLRSSGAQFSVHRAAAAIARRRPAARPATTADRAQATAVAASAPGGVFTGLGFDTCQTPSQTTMTGWLQSPFRAAGIYIGGANMACSQPNLTATWVSAQTVAGWHIVPIYVGLQAPANSCGCAPISTAAAAAQGSAAATDAVTSAEAIGIGPGNPIYDDMEAYNRTVTNTTAVLAYLGAWTATLHADGYVSGVYSSDSSGILDLVAQYGTTFAEPDDLWVANWNGAQSTVDANVPAADWANHQRLHQYRGGHDDTYGGAQLNVDSDYVDAATAGAGTGSGAPIAGPAAAPSLSITPTPNGTLEMTPSWTGQTGISSWQLEGGSSPSTLTPVGARIHATRTTPVSVRNSYAFYQVLALDSTGQTLGTSATIPTPAHVAMFGLSAYVPRQGPGGVPVACFESTSCTVTVTIRDGKRTVSNTGPESIAAGGGVAHFKLSSYWHKLIAAHKPLPVTIKVASTLAGQTSQAMKLVPYTTTGPRPPQSGTPSAQIRLVGGMEFVSHGWSGGVLAACVSTAPCRASTTIIAHGKVIARTNPQLLGAGMVGYLHFSLTRQGHLLLAHTTSNQLPVRVQVSSQDGATNDGASASSVSVASGQVTLASF